MGGGGGGGGCGNDALAIQNCITRTNNSDHSSHIYKEAEMSSVVVFMQLVFIP